MTPRRRQQDNRISAIRSAAKATVAFIFFGILSFVGTWGVTISSGVAKLREDVSVIHEKQEFLGTWLVDEMKRTREDIKDLRNEMKAVSSIHHEVSRIAAEQARRTSVIDAVRMGKAK